LEPVPYVSVPKVFHELSTDRVLTMAMMEGVSLHHWANGRPSRPRRDRLGGRLMELFTCQVHWFNALHADPHPGNYLIGSDDRIGLVDFGCVKFYSKAMAKLTRGFLDRIWAGSDEGIEAMIRLAWDPKTPSEKARARRVTLASIEFASLIYPDPARGSTVVDFSDPEPLRRMPDIWQMALKNRLSNPEFVFHCRAELGLYNMLHRLHARVDTALLADRVESLLGPLPRH
jgi:hypothetical protein